MKLNVMNVVYYSPTRTSQKVARAIAEGLGIARRQETDLTTDFRTDPIMVKDSICIVAAPVYGGLVAPAALERISRLRGENSVAIPVVVYGNRDYEDALVQLRDRLHELPKDKTIMVHCVKGYTSYVVARILMQNGFDNILSYAGGWGFYKSQQES